MPATRANAKRLRRASGSQLVRPTIDGGRWPVKRTVGDIVAVSADVFRDGHEVLRAVVRFARTGETALERGAAHAGRRPPQRRPLGRRVPGRRRRALAQWTIEAWVDVFAGWRDELARKVDVGQTDLSGEPSRGRRAPARRRRATPTDAADRATLEAAAAAHRERRARRARRSTPRSREIVERVAAALARPRRCRAPYEIDVDRVLGALRLLVRALPALVGRLQGRRGAAPAPRRARLRRPLPAADPPDRRHEPQGPQQHARRRPRRPGQPVGDRRRDRRPRRDPPRARHARGLRRPRRRRRRSTASTSRSTSRSTCSADHPWLKEHPEWFNRRPDGTLKYAENPPKKYQDIYNVNWDSDDWRSLWDALLEVVRHWVDHGVRVFRVDNPHTKPFAVLGVADRGDPRARTPT